VRTIAKRLNDAGRLCPRAQQGRPNGWAPSSVWTVLRRPLYRGEIVWNRTRKRNKWGEKSQKRRPTEDLIAVAAPDLRIVPESLWLAVQARAAAAKASYLKAAGGAFGRPADSHESKYLLTGFARCGQCGANMLVRTRAHGSRRVPFYACSGFHRRGSAVCGNSLHVRLELADDVILSEIERFVLHPKVVKRAIGLTIEALKPESSARHEERDRADRERRKAETEVRNLTAAVAAGGDLPSVLAALRVAEHRRQQAKDRIEALDQTLAFTSTMAADLNPWCSANWRSGAL
jgi:hypothetical protein